MDLYKAYNILNFFINKAQGAFFTFPELDQISDIGQLRYYKNCFIKYGTAQRLTDALAPFKVKANFTTDGAGLLITPDDYMDLIDIVPQNGSKVLSCPVINEDEITYRRKSQVIPNTSDNPFAEEVTDWNFQLYPQQQFSGILSYYKRPPPPFFSYTTVSGRIIVYDAADSQQFLWSDDEMESVLLACLESIGINMSEPDLLQWSQLKNSQNGVIKM